MREAYCQDIVSTVAQALRDIAELLESEARLLPYSKFDARAYSRTGHIPPGSIAQAGQAARESLVAYIPKTSRTGLEPSRSSTGGFLHRPPTLTAISDAVGPIASLIA